MKFKLFTIPCSLLLGITLFFAACSKEGPAGPAGATGPAGPAGPQGAKGDTGVANVIYSPWLDVSFKADTIHNGSVIDTVSFSATINAPKLTSTILDRGEIKVYVNIGTVATPSVAPLPLDAAAFGLIITPIYRVGSIRLISNDDASTFTTTGGQKSFQYRYILIPGGTGARLASKIDWNDYNQVKAYLGLKD